MGRGYLRLVETILLLSVLFLVITNIVQNKPASMANPSNPITLVRYGKDLSNMVCNSEKARRLILYGSAYPVYKDLVYVTPPDMGVRLIVDGTAYGSEEPDQYNVVSLGCVVSNNAGLEKKVIVQVWRK